jgi:predicted ATPase
MIKHIHIENFKCFKNFDLDLGPFNVLVGPNDSGKSTLLEAMQIFQAVCSHYPKDNRALINSGLPAFSDTAFTHGNEKSGIEIHLTSLFESDSDNVAVLTYNKDERGPESSARVELLRGGEIDAEDRSVYNWAETFIGELRSYRLEPSQLRKDSWKFNPPTHHDSSWLEAMGTSGLGFPTFLHDFLMNNRHRFFEMEKRFYKSFPAYEGGLDVEDVGEGKGTLWKLRFKTKFGQELEASEVSDGTMLYLAYLAIAYEAKGPMMLMVEEPENGIHHRSLEDVVSVLRKLAKDKDKQVILTTHSPYLLDLVEPEQVKVFSKQQDGTVKARTLADFSEADRLREHFGTGEIWTEFDESEIVQGKDEAEAGA